MLKQTANAQVEVWALVLCNSNDRDLPDVMKTMYQLLHRQPDHCEKDLRQPSGTIRFVETAWIPRQRESKLQLRPVQSVSEVVLLRSTL